MSHTSRSTFADTFARILSTLWHTVGSKLPLRHVADRIALYPVPFGLSTGYGVLYGWNMHEKLHPPEPETIAFFKKQLHEGDRVADIGANIGYYSLLFSQLVGPSGKVVSFEPSHKAHSQLVRATKHLSNVHTINKGVFSKHDTLTLYATRPGDPMGSFMYKRGKPTAEVEVVPLRDFSEDFNWAKIDVEGAELEVLKGMRKPIKAVLEVARGIIEDHHGGLESFFTKINDLGYSIYFIVDNGDTIPYTKDTLSKLQNNIFITPKT